MRRSSGQNGSGDATGSPSTLVKPSDVVDRPASRLLVNRSRRGAASTTDRLCVNRTDEMKVQHVVYQDGVIGVALVIASPSQSSTNLAIHWLKPHPSTDAG